MSINVAALINPQKNIRLNQESKCFFCSKKSRPVYLFSTKTGGHYVCGNCRVKIIEHFGRIPPNPEELIDNKNIFSGGAWETNRRKH